MSGPGTPTPAPTMGAAAADDALVDRLTQHMDVRFDKTDINVNALGNRMDLLSNSVEEVKLQAAKNVLSIEDLTNQLRELKKKTDAGSQDMTCLLYTSDAADE